MRKARRNNVPSALLTEAYPWAWGASCTFDIDIIGRLQYYQVVESFCSIVCPRPSSRDAIWVIFVFS